jgi:uncharacterized Rossmann fold enzyme
LADYELPLGKEWYDSFYDSLSSTLGYSKEADERSRDELSVLLKQKRRSGFNEVYESMIFKFKGKNCLVFGAGPSLEQDVMNLYPIARRAKNLVIAADGATDVLFQGNIVPQITVSDLDSSSMQVLISQSEERNLVVHAHGDNIEALSRLVPELGNNILGTTQVSSIENVRNLGGFMDGDRACYLASYFDPAVLVIAGMDFRTEEKDESLKNDAEKKRKLDFGKSSLEFLISRRPEIRFINSTTFGQEIKGAQKIETTKIIEELS